MSGLTPFGEGELEDVFRRLDAARLLNEPLEGEFTVQQYQDHIEQAGDGSITRPRVEVILEGLVKSGLLEKRKCPNRRVYYREVRKGE